MTDVAVARELFAAILDRNRRCGADDAASQTMRHRSGHARDRLGRRAVNRAHSAVAAIQATEPNTPTRCKLAERSMLWRSGMRMRLTYAPIGCILLV